MFNQLREAGSRSPPPLPPRALGRVARIHPAGRHATDAHEPRQVRKEAAISDVGCVVDRFRTDGSGHTSEGPGPQPPPPTPQPNASNSLKKPFCKCLTSKAPALCSPSISIDKGRCTCPTSAKSGSHLTTTRPTDAAADAEGPGDATATGGRRRPDRRVAPRRGARGEGKGAEGNLRPAPANDRGIRKLPEAHGARDGRVPQVRQPVPAARKCCRSWTTSNWRCRRPAASGSEKTIADGLSLTLKELLRILEKFNVTPDRGRGAAVQPRGPRGDPARAVRTACRKTPSCARCRRAT